MKRYKIISKDVLKEIKKRYEFGEALIDLAIEYKANYKTLRNISSKKKWEKGKRESIISAQEYLLETEEEALERLEIKKHFKAISKSLTAYTVELEKEKKRPTTKSREEAFKNRVQAVSSLWNLQKDIHNIRTPKEELELRRSMIEYEKLRDEIENDTVDVDLD